MKDATSPGALLHPKMRAVPLDPRLESSAPPYSIEYHPDVVAHWESPLPHDHPAWQRDMVVVSRRVRAILRTVEPVAIRVRTFWDHAVRSLAVRGRRLELDASGCYRVR